jgi:hypothetical protein
MLVTKPPTNSSGSVQTVVNNANRYGQGESIGCVSWGTVL